MVAKNTPLSCDRECNTHTSRCTHCDFPSWLPTQAKLIGKQGEYVLEKRLHTRGIGRQYSATKLNADTSVAIREYVLPERYFNREEQKLYQERFVSLAGLSLADGRKQDLRVITPLEAIADQSGQRCYLIAPALDNSLTLNQHCAQTGPLTIEATVRILDQVLQTLTCLHQQKFAIPTGQTRVGIVHGNISLNTLLLVQPTQVSRHSQNNSFVYLTDFALWENLFDPTQTETTRLDYQHDLTALGTVAFYLLKALRKFVIPRPTIPRPATPKP